MATAKRSRTRRQCQVSLHEWEYQAAKSEADRLGVSLAALLRRALLAMIPADQSRPWMRYAGMVASSDANANTNNSIDSVIYGEKS